MRLLFDLPDDIKQEISKNGITDILYAVPVDIDKDYKYANDWFVCDMEYMLIIRKGTAKEKYRISDGQNYKTEFFWGNGLIVGEFDGKPVDVVRFKMTHAPRFSSIAISLNRINKNEMPEQSDEKNEKMCPKCGRILPWGSSTCPNCVNKLQMFKKLAVMTKPYLFHIIATFILFWTISGLRLVEPMLFRGMIDGFFETDTYDLNVLFFFVSLIAGRSILSTILGIFRNRIMVNYSSGLSKDLRNAVFSKIQALSINFINQKRAGDLMNRVNNDTGVIQNFIQNQSVTALNQLFMLIGVLVIIFVKNWQLALLVLIPVPFAIYFYKLIWKVMRKAYGKQWSCMVKANSALQDVIYGIKVVKAFGKEEKEIERFRKLHKDFADVSGGNEKKWNTYFPLLGYLFGVGNFLILIYGGSKILDFQMTFGEMVEFSSYAGMLLEPLQWMTYIPRWLAETATALSRVFEVLDEEPDVGNAKNAISARINGDVTFDNITFGYKIHDPVIKDVSVDIKAGEMIGLVGHSGAGKSTMINLVMRLYDVNKGRILVDGTDIRDLDQNSLRTQIGVVLQETFLFNGTILENIKYSKPNASYEEVIRAAKIANAHDFIVGFPDGYDTKVGERGQRLSGGERQRISIARAIINDPRLLILDEATSSLDTETEQLIQEALGRLVKNRTTFAIAHRLSTLRNANRLLVMEKGEIAEVGTHEELIAKKGIYYGLVIAQRRMTKLKEIPMEVVK